MPSHMTYRAHTPSEVPQGVRGSFYNGNNLRVQLSIGYSDPRLNLNITDGIKWVQDAEENTYDAIIVDSSDPVGPAEVLFQKVCLLLVCCHMHDATCLSTCYIVLPIIDAASHVSQQG